MNSLFPHAPVATSLSERIGSLDFLRGIAILGILFINIESFAYPNPWSSWQYGYEASIDHDVRFWVYFLTQGKFYTMFALLFGVGFMIFLDRVKHQTTRLPGYDIYCRRLLWLFVFGVIHAYFIWDGDILFHYAICGLLLLPFRTMAKKTLAFVIIILAIFPLINAHQSFAKRLLAQEKYEASLAIAESNRTSDDDQIISAWEKRYSKKEPLKEDFKPLKPTFLAGITHTFDHLKVHKGVFYHQSIVLSSLIVMMIGMLLYRAGIFTDYRHLKHYWLITIVFLVVSLFINYQRYYHWTYLDHTPVTQWWKAMAFTFPRETLGISYVLLFNGLYQKFLSGRTKLISNVGRMALSNYIFQSIVLGLIFYGYGFDLHNTLSRFQLLGIVASLWAIQLLFTHLWLLYNTQGPLEKLWRHLTYSSFQL